MSSQRSKAFVHGVHEFTRAGHLDDAINSIIFSSQYDFYLILFSGFSVHIFIYYNIILFLGLL